MEKLETKIIETEYRTHHFYCDDCGTYLGASGEYDDGYYEELGNFELKIFMPRGWYRLDKCLCNNCSGKFLDKAYDTLKNAGFKPDWED